MNDFEEFANQRALEKASEEMGNKYLDKVLSKQASDDDKSTLGRAAIGGLGGAAVGGAVAVGSTIKKDLPAMAKKAPHLKGKSVEQLKKSPTIKRFADKVTKSRNKGLKIGGGIGMGLGAISSLGGGKKNDQ